MHSSLKPVIRIFAGDSAATFTSRELRPGLFNDTAARHVMPMGLIIAIRMMPQRNGMTREMILHQPRIRCQLLATGYFALSFGKY